MSDMITPGGRVAILGFDGFQALDVVGPFEAFAKANEHLPPEDCPYEILLASPDGEAIRSNAGLTLSVTHALAELPAQLDTLVVAGGSETGLRAAVAETELIGWLQGRAGSTRRVASVCTGAFVLGAAGLLAGRRATTHWGACHLLQDMWPDIDVDADAIYTADPPIYTSAGVTTGIDLSLALIEADHGSAVALAVARDLVLYMRRPGSQAQFSTPLQSQVAAGSRFSRLVADMIEDPGSDLSVPALAEKVGMSERTFVRRFRRETGTSPAQFVKRLRIDHARTLLVSTDWPLARIAERSGIASLASLHRLFLKHVGVTPTEYRQRFG
ncbi:GlxA family transcriptional regulator [Natronospirillum operosum]|uniref:GlxA family transcriptional regulator n=1 Tax=Natronospirillum operosum TaxID=2759953 RepID=A0A4Z0WF13_9GAMM|nr:GlxA family transcriptional regulator [Natronospirillum operosum]TGG93886.1 GlxA family transcriptional regulator [Natronospirillum operosum]